MTEWDDVDHARASEHLSITHRVRRGKDSYVGRAVGHRRKERGHRDHGNESREVVGSGSSGNRGVGGGGRGRGLWGGGFLGRGCLLRVLFVVLFHAHLVRGIGVAAQQEDAGHEGVGDDGSRARHLDHDFDLMGVSRICGEAICTAGCLHGRM